MEYRDITEDEIRAYNYGIKQAQWQITKFMMGLDFNERGPAHEDIKISLKFIHEEIEKELK